MDTRTMDQAIGKILELHISEDDCDGRNSSAMTDYSDEEEHTFDLPKGSKSELKNIQAYLEQMDRQLAKTAVGQSFVREGREGDTRKYVEISIRENFTKSEKQKTSASATHWFEPWGMRPYK